MKVSEIFKNHRFIIRVSVVVFLLTLIGTSLITSLIVKNRYSNYESIVTVYSTLIHAYENQSRSTPHMYAVVENKYFERPAKYRDVYELSIELDRSANSLISLIVEIKLKIMESDKIDLEDMDRNILETVFVRENYEEELSECIMAYRNLLLSSIEDKSNLSFKRIRDDLLPMEDVNVELFYKDLLAISSLVMLTNMQLMVKNSEYELLCYILAQLESDSGMFSYEGIVAVSKPYVNLGDEYTSKVTVGISHSHLKPEVYLTTDYPFYDSVFNGWSFEYTLNEDANYLVLPLSDNEEGLYKIKCDSSGEFRYGGLIFYASNKGEDGTPFQSNYYVGE